MMKIDLVVDLQYGSTGKGLLAGWLAIQNEYDGVATCNMPNAGHTYIDQHGNEMIHKVLPNGIVSPNLKYVFIGPGAVFDYDRLMQEIAGAQQLGYLTNARIVIHPNACMVEDRHKKFEEAELSAIGSTAQGSALVSMEKMMRPTDRDVTVGQNRRMFEGIDLIYVPTHIGWMTCVNACDNILAEGCQGFSLGINQKFYPYCTSRECTPFRLLSDMGLPQITPIVWGTLRTFPIRVGGTSGPCYPDQTELSWEELGQKPELTTVTKRIRRVFTFSRLQLDEALWHCRPDHLFLNFCNYMEPAELGRLTNDINQIAGSYETEIALTGTGPNHNDIHVFDPGSIAGQFRESLAHHNDTALPITS